MQIHKLPIGRGLDWFKQAIDLGGHNPKGIFGAALLMVVVFYAIVLAVVVAMQAVLPDNSGDSPDIAAVLQQIAPFVLLLMLLIALLAPFLIGGLMHVIRETEGGRKPGALALFQPFRSGVAGRLMLVGVIVLAIQVIGGVLVMLTGGQDYIADYMAMMQQLMSGTDPASIVPPQGNLLMFLLQLAVNYIAYAVLLFAVPSILFMRVGLGEALGGSLQASFRNIGANLLAGLLLVIALVIASLLFGLLLLLALLVANAIHATLAALVSLVLMVLFASAVLVVTIGAAWLAWRDTFGDGPTTTRPSTSVSELEA